MQTSYIAEFSQLEFDKYVECKKFIDFYIILQRCL